MTLAAASRAMASAGIRRVAVISGDADYSLTMAARWFDALAGDWLCLSDVPRPRPALCASGVPYLTGA